MNHLIRSYKNSEYEMVCSWWKEFTNQEPLSGMLIENGTFILELNDMPALCITVFLTQSKDMAYIANFIKNPIFFQNNLEDYGKKLWNHCFNWAYEQGYSRVLCFSDNPKLSVKYEKFGMKPTLTNLTGFLKVL